MQVTIQLTTLEAIKPKDPGPKAEPYLWPVFFKVDAETLARVSIRVLEDDNHNFTDTTLMLLESLVDNWPGDFDDPQTWLVSTSGAHGNIGKGMSKGQTRSIPTNVGKTEFDIELGSMVESIQNFKESMLCGVTVVGLEEDSLPRTRRIRNSYREFRNTIEETITNEIIDQVRMLADEVVLTEIFPGVRVPKEGVPRKTDATQARNMLFRVKNKLKKGLGLVDDVIGTGFKTWTLSQLEQIDNQTTPEDIFTFNWAKQSGSEAGHFRLNGKMVVNS